MGAATATVHSKTGGGVRPDELRAALDQALAASDADESIGPRIRATGLRMRFDLPDAAIVLYVRAGGEREPNLVWSYDEAPDWRPRLELEMSAEVANHYLQGRESLAIAIARGQVRCRGESRAALAYLPAARLICEPYRRVIAAGFPDLVAA
jgi:hypothetical protein